MIPNETGQTEERCNLDGKLRISARRPYRLTVTVPRCSRPREALASVYSVATAVGCPASMSPLIMIWPAAESLETARFLLEPVTEDHAAEMVEVLASPDLYRFTGGEPPTAQILQARYARQSTGRSPDGGAGWLNWIIRTRATGQAIGFVQATLTGVDEELAGELAWLITPSAQRRGAARESSAAVLVWLKRRHVRSVQALIHPDHVASALVAQRLGLAASSASVDGETLWEATLF